MQCMSLKVCLSHYLTKFIPSGWLSAVFIRNALCVVGDCKPVGVQPFWVYMSYMDGKFNCTLISVNILTETTKVIKGSLLVKSVLLKSVLAKSVLLKSMLAKSVLLKSVLLKSMLLTSVLLQ